MKQVREEVVTQVRKRIFNLSYPDSCAAQGRRCSIHARLGCCRTDGVGEIEIIKNGIEVGFRKVCGLPSWRPITPFRL